jgi:photosystem II stability/assembly factor-like uncharacterized protein
MMADNYSERDEDVAQARGISVWQVEQLQLTRGLSNQVIRELPEAVLRRSIQRLEYPDSPRARAAFRLATQKNEAGAIPADALSNALSQLSNIRTRETLQPRVAGIPSGQQVIPKSLGHVPLPTAGLEGATWNSLGPGNIGGRTRSLSIYPNNSDTLWAGSVSGGVWRSEDGGQSWFPVDDFMVNLAVSSMVMDPTNPDVIYAGTGEGFFSGDSIRGAGIFRTVDGVTWQQLSSTTGEDFQWVNRLAVSSDGTVLLAAGRTGILRSDDPDRLNWMQTLREDIADIDFHPTDSTQAIAGSRENGRAYYSINGGLTWQLATSTELWGDGRVEVTYAANNPMIVYASLQRNRGEIWRSTDGGRTYSKRGSRRSTGSSPARYLGDQGWYGNAIWAGDPSNSNLVIVGGLDLWKSTDGGNTLREISTWWAAPQSAHADHHCIVAHPQFDGQTNKIVFFGNDGGIYKTEDVYNVGDNSVLPYTNGWIELNNTYGVTQFFGAAGNINSGTIIGGTQDNGTLRFTGDTENWTVMFGGDGGWCAADPVNAQYFYGEYVYLNIHRSSDGGQTSEYISGQYWDESQGRLRWKTPPYRIEDAYNNSALFIAPFILDPNDANRILAGGMSLWRTNEAKTPNTNNTGPRWRAIKISMGSRISAMAVAQGNENIIWVGHEDGAIYKTLNGTNTNPDWQRVDSVVANNSLSIRRFCTQITIDPQNHHIVYVTFGGYTKGNVWKTTDGGLTWTNIGERLPEAPVRALAIHPRESSFIYIGTEVGVFASENGGVNWSPTNEGPTNCSVDDLFWMGETLVAATHGRGMFKIDLSI